jgi:DNA-binding CsgD family transcriptional regulator
MSVHDHPASDSHASKCAERSTPAEDPRETAQLPVAGIRTADEAGAALARQLNGSLTALLLYMNEIKQHSHQFFQPPGSRLYLQQVVDNALQQTERVCAMVKQLAGHHPTPASDCEQARERPAGGNRDGERQPGVIFALESGQKPLTRREREVLGLISEGYTNKQGGLRMKISPRTFESHRAEAMRKLGARNTADLVRKALLQSA